MMLINCVWIILFNLIRYFWKNVFFIHRYINNYLFLYLENNTTETYVIKYKPNISRNSLHILKITKY